MQETTQTLSYEEDDSVDLPMDADGSIVALTASAEASKDCEKVDVQGNLEGEQALAEKVPAEKLTMETLVPAAAATAGP